ncbi:MAG: hypothetical protein ACYDCF_08370 [Burkholderiales bacterium]
MNNIDDMIYFDQRAGDGKFRLVNRGDREIVEIKTLELIRVETAKYKEDFRKQAQVFVAWLAGTEKGALLRTDEEKRMLGDLIMKRGDALAQNSMEAQRVYAELVRLGAEIAEARIKLIEERARAAVRVAVDNSGSGDAGTADQPKAVKARKATPDLRLVSM